MTSPERFLYANAALVQIIDAEAKLAAARENIEAVLHDLGIENPARAAIRITIADTKVAKELIDQLCVRLK